MPPRLPSLLPMALRITPASIHTTLPHTRPKCILPLLQSIQSHDTNTRSFHITPIPLGGGPRTYPGGRKPRKDRYAAAKAKERREKNLARQKVLIKERAAASCDPVAGNDTPYTSQVLDARPIPLPSIDAVVKHPAADDLSNINQQRFNHFLTKDTLAQYLKTSKQLAYPQSGRGTDPMAERSQELKHMHAVEAVRRIVSLGNGSNKDKLRENKQRSIETFGRHVTDHVLPPDPTTPGAKKKPFEKTPRAGPDTGSSEVQAAVLTAKIRALIEHVQNNKKDVMNKRNLRLLVHKRQKILKYLKKKEKGGVRYRNVMEQLGLDERAIEEELML